MAAEAPETPAIRQALFLADAEEAEPFYDLDPKFRDTIRFFGRNLG